MMNSLDLLIIVFLGLAVIGLLSLAVLWLVKKPLIRRICLFASAALSLYLAGVAVYIGRFVFVGQTVVGIVLGLAAIAAVVLDLRGKSDKAVLLSRILVTAGVLLGLVNVAI